MMRVQLLLQLQFQLLLLPLALIALGCGGQRALPAPARFDRPNRVDFVCVKKDKNGNQKPVELASCRNEPDTTNSVALHALVTQSARGELAAINLETSTVIDNRKDIPGYTFVPVGELPSGIVVPPTHPDLIYVADFGSHDLRVLATSSLIGPLVGSADVQEPVALNVETSDGLVPARPTDMVLAPDENALLLSVPELGRVLWVPLQRCDGTQTDCHEGWIDEPGIASIELQGSADRLVTTMPDAQPAAPRYEELCGFKRPEPPAPSPVPAPPSDALMMTTPRPSALAIDAFCRGEADCHRRLLVADEALPLIHAVDLDAITAGSHGGDALLPPLLVGVPTKDVVVTPRVPVTPDSMDETQYVYAIDATDGSVLVVENGEVINVSSDPTARADRIELAGASTSAIAAARLAILTPDFNVTHNGNQYVKRVAAPTTMAAPPNTTSNTELFCTDDRHASEDPARLRGVFLAAALSDGTVRIFDIHDMELRASDPPTDATMDKGPLRCRVCPTKQPPFDGIPVLVRHHARLLFNFIGDTGADARPFAPASTPVFRVLGAQFPIRADGTHGSPDAPELRCVACGDGLVSVFPPLGQMGTVAEDDAGVGSADVCTKEKPALLCGVADPWISDGETWAARYEGAIPGTLTAGEIPGSDPADHTGVRTIMTDVEVCKAGVLGADDISPLYAADGCPMKKILRGDQLVIRERLATSPDAAMYRALGPKYKAAAPAKKQACADAGKALENDPTLVLGFEIQRAFADHLVITANALAHPVGTLKNYDELLDCLGDRPVSFEVHSLGSFTVLGLHAGFLHRVKSRADGRCVLDPDGDPLLRGRAWVGCPFYNRTLAFQLGVESASERPPLPGATLAILNQTPAAKLLLNATVAGFSTLTIVPVQLRYNEMDRRLYLLDISDRGLVTVPLDPFPTTVDSTHSFN